MEPPEEIINLNDYYGRINLTTANPRGILAAMTATDPNMNDRKDVTLDSADVQDVYPPTDVGLRSSVEGAPAVASGSGSPAPEPRTSDEFPPKKKLGAPRKRPEGLPCFVGTRVTQELYDLIQEEADEEGCKISHVVRAILERTFRV